MINFAKHNKGLRLLATLFNDIEIFETEAFQDIYTSVDTYSNRKDQIYLLYKAPLYDEYIINKLKSYKNFIESKYVVINGISYILYVYIVLKEKQLYYSYLLSIGGVGITQIEMLNVFIFWRKYLDKEFYNCYYCEKCENVLKIKGAILRPSSFNYLKFVCRNSYAYLVNLVFQ